VLLSAFVCVLVFAGVSARAMVTHEYLSQIVEVPAVGPHGEAVPFPGPLSEVESLTADSGNVWLAEHIGGTHNSRVDEFDGSSGAFVQQLPQVPGVGSLKSGIAVGHATGEANVYVTSDESEGESSRGVVLVFGASGSLLGKWTEAGPGKAFGVFGNGAENSLVAVDGSGGIGDWAAGDVYVADPENKMVDVFEPESAGKEKLVAELSGPSPTELFSGPRDVAVSDFNGDVLVVDGENSVDIFKPAALSGQYEFVGKLSGPPPSGSFQRINNLTVDGSDGDIYVADEGTVAGVVDEFDAAGAYLGRVTGEATPAGNFQFVLSIAVDTLTHRLFVGDYHNTGNNTAVDVFGENLVFPDVATGAASGVGTTSVTLSGTVNPDGAGAATCRFDYGTSLSFGLVVPCSSPVPDGNNLVPVQATLTGLEPDTTYYYRLEATNENGTNPGDESQDGSFRTLGPGVLDESVSNVASGSVTFDATIDPHGDRTSYYFQYGTSTSYGASVPVAPGAGIGSGEGDVDVSQHVQEGLSAATTYHYRVVAVSELEVGRVEAFVGPDRTFTTQSAGGGLVLSDGRKWEMVTPPEKRGAQIYAIGQYSNNGAVIQASAEGDALTWIADDPTEAEPQGYSNLVQGFSARGSGGWVSRNITVPHLDGTSVSVGEGEEYRFFSEDLSRGAVQPFLNAPLLSGEASERTAYLSSVYLNGVPGDSCSVSCFRPLVTGKPGYANVPAGTVFGEFNGPHFVGATPDLSHVVLNSAAALTSPPTRYGLYEWSGGELVLVSVLPGPGGEAIEGQLGQSLNAWHAISDDGSRVFWTGRETGEGTQSLFMRDIPRKETLLIGEGVEFEDATPDGSIVFFSGHECEIKQNGSTGVLECSVSDLGGRIVGTSTDGSWVYFVSPELFASGGVRGAENLYVRHDGATRFITVVSVADARRLAVTSGDLSELTSRVSSNGRWLTFMSDSSLAGANTTDAVTGLPDEEVYLYDAEGNGGGGRLVCASCNPSGARPVGVGYPFEDTLWGGDRVWDPGTQLASNTPGGTPYKLSHALYQSRFLSDSGRLFFNSNDGLVPQDVNGTWDVYEYEPPGVGDCGRSSVTFSERSNGCVGLVSSGGSGEESGFLDASLTGSDVFFLTSAKLAGQDFDTALDVYDAHECSSGAPCFGPSPVLPPVCDTGDACKAAPTPQPAVFGSPSSATFAGAGNVVSGVSKRGVSAKGLTRAQKLVRALRACRKWRGRRRASCVRHAKARYAAGKRLGVTSGKRGRG
jgi:hypothetical protein